MLERDERPATPNGPPPRAVYEAATHGEEGLVRYHLRDIIGRRVVGDYVSMDAALAALEGRDEGHFSINNHRGEWCEVEVREGVRYVRYTLMSGGAPADYRAMVREGQAM